MSFWDEKRKLIQKRVQRILEKLQLWPIESLNLEYLKPKYFNCQVVIDCKIYIKGHKYDLYKSLQNHSIPNIEKIGNMMYMHLGKSIINIYLRNIMLYVQ